MVMIFVIGLTITSAVLIILFSKLRFHVRRMIIAAMIPVALKRNSVVLSMERMVHPRNVWIPAGMNARIMQWY